MVGCMVATSLSMAPAMLVTPQARFVDLDGPLLLARDRDHGLRYDDSLVYPPDSVALGLMPSSRCRADQITSAPAAAIAAMT